MVCNHVYTEKRETGLTHIPVGHLYWLSKLRNCVGPFSLTVVALLKSPWSTGRCCTECPDQTSVRWSPVNALVIRFNLSELYERLFYRRFEWCMCMCVWGIGSKRNTGVSKANSASSHIWLKLSSESILNRWRENRNASMDWLGFFLLYISGQNFGFIWNNNLLLKKLFWFLSMLKTVVLPNIYIQNSLMNRNLKRTAFIWNRNIL